MKRRDLIASMCSAGLLAGCGDVSALRTAVKCGMSTPADENTNGVYVWFKAFTGVLKSAGFHARVYPNSSIGGERERVFQLQLGLMELNATGGDEVGRWSPLAYAAARPFLIQTYDHMDRLLSQTPYLERVSKDFEPHGFHQVDVAYTGSMVGLFTRGTPVRTLDDLRKLRLRVLSAADLDLLNAWRVRGVQVAWEEVAQALQTGMVDAYLNPPNVAPMFGHGAVLDYFTDLGMGPALRSIIVSLPWLESLSADQLSIVTEAYRIARDANRTWTRKAIIEDRARLEKTGIEWITLTSDERQEWVDASDAIPPGRWETDEARSQFLAWAEMTREAVQ